MGAGDAQLQVNATYNWWGVSSGPKLGDCYGNINCSHPLEHPPNLTFSYVLNPDETVLKGETVNITSTVENTGKFESTTTVEFYADGMEVANETVTVDGGNSTTVEFSTSFATAGIHNLTVEDLAPTNITIEEPAFFAVSDLQPTDYVAEHDEVFTVNATVENTGDLSATKTVELRLDGETVANKSVELDAGNSTSVEFVVDASEIDAGEYTHSVWTEDEGVEGTLTVEPKAPIVVDDPANDLDDDGKYEDVNGDGEFNIVDVQALYANHDSDVVQTNVDLFDFNDDGEVNLNDVQALYRQT